MLSFIILHDSLRISSNENSWVLILSPPPPRTSVLQRAQINQEEIAAFIPQQLLLHPRQSIIYYYLSIQELFLDGFL